jgi:hypothetical protein
MTVILSILREIRTYYKKKRAVMKMGVVMKIRAVMKFLSHTTNGWDKYHLSHGRR